MAKDITRKENILACVSTSLTSQKVLKISSQISDFMGGNLFAVYVQTSSHLSAQDSKQLKDNIAYAKQQGVQLAIIKSLDTAKAISQYAKEHKIDKIVIGRSQKPRNRLEAYMVLAKRLQRKVPNIEVITIPTMLASYDPESPKDSLVPSFKDIVISLSLLTLASLVCMLFHHLGFTDATLITVYILAVLLISFYTKGYVCGAVSSLLSVSVFNFLFTVPLYSLRSYGAGYPVTLIIMFIAAFLTSSLTGQVKKQAQQHAQNAYRTEVLLNSNRRLQSVIGEDAILNEATLQIQKLLLRSIILYPLKDDQLDTPRLFPLGDETEALSQLANKSEEYKVANWVKENNTQAGATTGIFSEAAFWYLTIRINESEAVAAVIGIRVDNEETIDPFDVNLLLAMLGECAVALENEKLNRSKEEYAFRVKQEQLRSDLLRSISHDLRTPLTSISGSASMLMKGEIKDPQAQQQLYADIYEDSQWLIQLVENLLSITRMDDGRVQLHNQPQDVNDIIDATVSHMSSNLKGHNLKVEKSSGLLIVNVDVSLIVQLLVNLVDNAVKYSGTDKDIILSSKLDKNEALIEVADRGLGIPDSEKGKVFEMFYTIHDPVSSDGRRGLGLGLALCRTIASAHGGSLKIADNKPQGCIFELRLPLMNKE